MTSMTNTANTSPKVQSLSFIVVIIKEEEEKLLRKSMDTADCPLAFQALCKGTASREMLRYLGLGHSRRLLSLILVPRNRAQEIMHHLNRDLVFLKRGGGICFSIPVVSAQYALVQSVCHQQNMSSFHRRTSPGDKDMKEAFPYCLILVAAEYGCSDDIVQAACKAGARGGTVIKGRKRGMEEVIEFLGLKLQAEQEITLILVNREIKNEVMNAINQVCGIATPAHGLIVAVPVEEVMGLE